MNGKFQTRFEPSSRKVRVLCAVAALAATIASLGSIDALSYYYSTLAPSVGTSAPIVATAS